MRAVEHSAALGRVRFGFDLFQEGRPYRNQTIKVSPEQNSTRTSSIFRIGVKQDEIIASCHVELTVRNVIDQLLVLLECCDWQHEVYIDLCDILPTISKLSRKEVRSHILFEFRESPHESPYSCFSLYEVSQSTLAKL